MKRLVRIVSLATGIVGTLGLVAMIVCRFQVVELTEAEYVLVYWKHYAALIGCHAVSVLADRWLHAKRTPECVQCDDCAMLVCVDIQQWYPFGCGRGVAKEMEGSGDGKA